MDLIGVSYDFDPSIFIGVYLLMLLIYVSWKRLVKKEGLDKRNFIIVAGFLFYILSLIKVVFFPILYLYENDMTFTLDYYYQLIPFATIIKVAAFGNWIQIIGNVALLLPLPIFILLLSRKPIGIKKTFLISLAVSLSIEIIQFVINLLTKEPNKVADVDDLILNVTGALIGWVLMRCLLSMNKFSRIKSLLNLNANA